MRWRVVIAGSRNFDDYEVAKIGIEKCMQEFGIQGEVTLLSGKCCGADRLGERYATENGWIIEEYPALWKQYGKAAGPIRNRQMVEVCDAVICFWEGKSKGTKSLIQYAKQCGKCLSVHIVSL